MPLPKDSANAEFAPTNAHHLVPGHPSLEQVSSRRNELDNSELGVPPQIPITPLPPPFIAEQHRPPRRLTHVSPYTPQWLTSIGYKSLVTTAVTILSTQFQLFTMATTTTIHTLLSFGMIFELLAILLTISFLQFHQYSEERHPLRPRPVLVRLALGMPIMLAFMGAVCLAAAFAVEMLKTSLDAAVAMCGLLIVGIILCIVVSCFGAYGRL